MSFLMTFVVVGLVAMGLICIAAIIAEIVELINNFKK